jgi:hypothetical protein
MLAKDTDLMRKTDRFTVEALQLRAPQASGDDLSELKTLFDSGRLFPEVTEEEKRWSIWNNIPRIACLIPSLYTLFEDLKLLSPCVKIIKVLIEPPFKGSLHDMMEQHFSGANQTPGAVVTQDTETMFNSCEGSVTDQFEFGYRQLYLFALRHFPQMIGKCPKKEKDRPKPTIEEPDPVTWSRFALLADRLGFDSKVIRQLKADDPYRTEARNFLLKHNPPEFYTFNQQLFEDCVEQMAKTRAAVVEKDRQYIKPPLVADGPGEPLPRRCGRFFQTAHEYERNYLFLDVLYDATDVRGKGITSFFAKRSIYFAFFGRRVPSASADVRGGKPPQNPEGNMNGESDGGSLHNADPEPAPDHALVADSSARKRARRERPTPPPPSSQEQPALVPRHLTSQPSESVCIHSHYLDYAHFES